MLLTEDQLKAYRDDGYLIVPEVFSPAEVQRLRADLRAAMAEDSPRRVLESNGRAVRGVHGQHTTFDSFARLVRHPRLVERARQILDEEIFVYQFKINMKAAFDGDVWPWHQDYTFWRMEDGMSGCRLVNIAVMIDDNTEFNGPLLLMAGSHREDDLDVEPPSSHRQPQATGPRWLKHFSADLKYALQRDRLRALAERYPIEAAKGTSGSVLFFHPNIVHGSTSNITPFDRCLVVITYNSVQNRLQPVPNPRPDFLVNRDTTPIVAGPDSILLD